MSVSSPTPTKYREHYGYDPLDRLTSMEEADGTLTQFSYDKGGNRLAESLMPAQARLLRTSATASATAANNAVEHNYRYAPGSNRLIATTYTGQVAATDDSDMQKTATQKHSASSAELVNSAWLYHATGVPLAQLDLNQAARQARSNSKHNTSRRIVYNSAKRPIAVYDSNNQLIASYDYNGQGERIAKTVYTDKIGTTSYSLYSEQRLAAETDAEGHITAHYVYLYGKPIAKIEMTANASVTYKTWKAITSLGGILPSKEIDASDTQASIYAIHTDHLGTPQAITDAQQGIVWQADTTPFGMTKVSYAAMIKTEARVQTRSATED